MVEVKVGEKRVSSYLPNPGKLLELLLPSAKVIMIKFKEGKLPYLVLGVIKDGEAVLLHTHLTNQIIAELIERGEIPFYRGFRVLKIEPSFGHSRFDLLLEKDGHKVLLEVKTCTLFNERIAMFPDAPSARGTKHLWHLAELSKKGLICECLFVVMSQKPTLFLPAYSIDLSFARAFYEVRKRVRLRAISLRISEDFREFSFYKELSIPWKKLETALEDRGLYLLVLKLERDQEIEIGALGRIFFKKGWYIYVGKAMKNLTQRLARHHRKLKKPRWHIDYLCSIAKLEAEFPLRAPKITECELAGLVKGFAEDEIPCFGSSDCQCLSHLYYFEDNPLRNRKFIEFLTDLRMNL